MYECGGIAGQEIFLTLGRVVLAQLSSENKGTICLTGEMRQVRPVDFGVADRL
jgi:hypothetical protein